MGAGIAITAREAGVPTLIHDPDPAARDRVDGVGWAASLADLADCDVVIEAAPERLDVKRELFAALAGVVAPDAVLATNTSSLLVSAIAAGVPQPQRVVGLHFFNPVPRMRLVELVPGAASSPAALARARGLAEALGKRVIEAADGPGFLVNRCNRPFSLEALRIVQERLATPEQVDRICRLGAGFRWGRSSSWTSSASTWGTRSRARSTTRRSSRAGARPRWPRGWRRVGGSAGSQAPAGTRTRRADPRIRPRPSRAAARAWW